MEVTLAIKFSPSLFEKSFYQMDESWRRAAIEEERKMMEINFFIGDRERGCSVISRMDSFARSFRR